MLSLIYPFFRHHHEYAVVLCKLAKKAVSPVANAMIEDNETLAVAMDQADV